MICSKHLVVPGALLVLKKGSYICVCLALFCQDLGQFITETHAACGEQEAQCIPPGPEEMYIRMGVRAQVGKQTAH